MIADTWIDEELFDKERTFDWRNWCDALLEAVEQDPSYAHSYWRSWKDKADELTGYNHFDLAIDILRYGVEKSATRLDAYARDACAAFCFGLGETLCEKGDWAEAIPNLEETFAQADRLDVWGKRNTLKWLSWAYMAEKRWADAIAAAEKRLAMAPDQDWGDHSRHTAHSWLGEAALHEKKYATAIKEFKVAIRLKEEVLAEDAEGNPEKMLHEDLAHYLVDLGIAYDRMGKSKQAASIFSKALPHVQHMLQEKMKMREREGCMWRREGRCHMLLAWTLERQSADAVSADPRILQEYELAEWVFRRTVYVEDDFVELGDLAAAEAAIQRVRSGLAYAYPDDEAFLRERLRLKIGSTRADWANRDYKSEVQKPRQRGHA